MGVYKKAVITNAGRALMARSIAGEIVMQFSRVITSSHIYPSDTDFKGYTSLEGIQQTVIPSNVQVVNDTLISVRGLFSNESISESYLIQNIGLYATDGVDEVLFSVSQATTPDEMPAYNGVAPSSFIYTIQATVSQASSLSLTINPAGTATTQDIMDLDDVKLDRQGDVSETVVETLETVEDKFPIPSAGDKIKQFLGKVLTFLKNIKPLEADVAYYVATTGSDTTGDGSSGNPFKTVQHAIDILPKNLGGRDATITMADGTYNEDISIVGFSGGALRLYSTHTEVSDNCKINSIFANSNSSYVFITGFNIITNTNSRHGITCYNCNNIIIRACKIVGTSIDWAGMYFAECNFQAFNNSVSNKNVALHAYKSDGVAGWWTDSNSNNIGLLATVGATIKMIGAQPSGTLRQETGGSLFYENGTQISDIISSGMSCAWGIIRGGYFKHGNSVGVAVVTVNLNIATTTALTVGIQYTISGFPRSFNEDIAVFCAETYFEHAWFSSIDGSIKVIPKVNVPVNTVVLLSTTYLTTDS